MGWRTKPRKVEDPDPPGARSPIRQRLGRRAVNGFIVSLLTLFAIDATPAALRVHKYLQLGPVDTVLDATGLWQSRWNLFAPEPDKVNTYVSARLVFAAGATLDWRSPRWDGRPALERARLFRHMEYFDSVRMDDNRGAWDALARWLAENEGRKRRGVLPVRVELTRHWSETPPPSGLGLLDAIEPGPFPERSFLFHTWVSR